MNSGRPASQRQNLQEVVGGVFEAAWPLFSVMVIVTVLAAAIGSGGKIDVLTWPAIRYAVEDCGSKPECSVYKQMTVDYSILAFGAAFFLLLNGLSFIKNVQKLDKNLIRNLGVNIRFFTLTPTFLWLFKITLLDSTKYSITFDEWTVIFIFGGCAVADLLILIVLWRQKSHAVWSENREVRGALLYIDIPTVIGVWLIAKYAPILLKDSPTQDMMLRAISGGALVMHVVTSQFILCFLIAEAKLGRFFVAHWTKRLSKSSLD